MDTQAHDNQARSSYDDVTSSGGASLLKESNRSMTGEADVSVKHWHPPPSISTMTRR